ncbi:hypothetical protein NCAS_0A09120 [Naumovozyma castellii]|uniref:Uncharacterized protein n=1 Tax=Naumovozyma castellii TaxID=27288 RepID=G0V7M2_NAUCA|nr:hypothetical protein NCAS_0A09120 [Naumovozyma castellii CBS 4309]CCC67470.1 hypothetical protein NCAS_0A09120 [Naumovozyma castellii CBS 4309]
MERNKQPSTLGRNIIPLLCALASMVTGSVGIALTCKFHKTEAVLIIITCATYLYSLITFTSLFRLRSRICEVIGLLSICFQLLILGSAIEYFNWNVKHSMIPNSTIQKHLLIAMNSLLLFSLFLNGINIGFYFESKNYNNLEEADEGSDQKITFVDQEKFIPLKDSTQTLTPGMDLFYPKKFNIENQQNYSGYATEPEPMFSDDHSERSVIRHQLGPSSNHHIRETDLSKHENLPSRGRSNSMNKIFKRSFLKIKDLKLVSSLQSNSEQLAKDETSQTGNDLNTRYITRLSTISDISKSILNIGANPQQDSNRNQNNENIQNSIERPFSVMIDNPHRKSQGMCMYETETQTSPALELEKKAIGRIDSSLLRPCLRLSNRMPSSISEEEQTNQLSHPPSPLIPQMETFDVEAFEETIKQQNMHSMFDSSYDEHDTPEHIELPETVTLDIWEQDKKQILERANNLQQKVLLPPLELAFERESNSPLEPSIESKKTFSFPGKSPIMDKLMEERKTMEGTINELDKYLNDFEIDEAEKEQILENSLRQDMSPTLTAEKASRDLHRAATNHSPTKSIISIISGSANNNYHTHKTRNSLSNFLGGHTRTSSQLTFMYPSQTNAKAVSNPSSPTRSKRFKRLSKKLSLSNVSDSMLHSTFLPDNNNHDMKTNSEFFNFTPKGQHNRGKSFDFSYLHSLQNSPTKQTSGMSRNVSLQRELPYSNTSSPGKASRRTSSHFYMQQENTTYTFDCNKPVDTTVLEEPVGIREPSSTTPSIVSNGSEALYPELIISEYDREKWNTITNLHLNDI